MSMLKSTTNSSKIINLQKEQNLLMNVRGELSSILNMVNESINELKVEQLQLKSHEISSSTSSKQNMKSPPENHVALWTSSSALKLCDDRNQTDDKNKINKQKIILDAFPRNKRKHCQMEEDDDEEEID